MTSFRGYDESVIPAAAHLTAAYLRAETSFDNPAEISIGLHPDFRAHHLPSPPAGETDPRSYYAAGCRGDGQIIRWLTRDELDGAKKAVPAAHGLDLSDNLVTAAYIEITHPLASGRRIRVLDLMRFELITGTSRAEGKLARLAIDLWRFTHSPNKLRLLGVRRTRLLSRNVPKGVK